MNDIRFAWRQLSRQPGFTVVALVTLALGIGVTTTIFSVLNGVLLRPLPYEDPDRVVLLWEVTEQGREIHVSAPNFHDWKEQAGSFEAMALHSSPDFGGPTTVLGGRTATRARVAAVSPEFFRVLGRQPVQGRAFAPDDFRWGADVAIVSHRFWQDQLGGTPDLAASMVDVYGRPRQVVGVLPPGFHYPGATDIWGALPPVEDGRTAHNWQVVARLGPGVTLRAARGEMSRLAQRLAREYGSETDAASVRVTPLLEEIVGPVRRPLTMLLGAAGLVLLVACTNLASTLLARGAGRQRELVIRESLGATRGRLVRQFLMESAVLAGLGAVAGLLLSWLLLNGILASAPALPRIDELRIDGRVLAFTGGMAVVTTFLFGLWPALRAARPERQSALAREGRSSLPHHAGPWRMLIAGEIAMALVLLIGAGLLIRSFWEVLDQETGFTPEQILTVELSPPESAYGEGETRGQYFRRVLEELTTVPGVEAAGLVNHPPLGGLSWSGDFEVEGRGPGSGAADYRIASGGYFAALGITVLRGRPFDERDATADGDVVVIDRLLAERIWPGEDPVGKRIRNLANDVWIYPDRWLTIIGVVEPVRHDGVIADPRPTIYVDFRQRPARLASATFALRASVPLDALVRPVRERILAVDPAVPAEFSTMQRAVGNAVSARRFTMLILAGFAALALILSAVGIYGVVAYAVQRRTREMGIRLALGASPRVLLGRVLGDSMRVVAAGALLGAAGAMALTRVIQGLLYGTRPFDPVVLGTAALLLAAVAGLATYLPARRATRVNPVEALRHE